MSTQTSREEKQISIQIDNQLVKWRKAHHQVKKILLLSTRSSGGTTILHQLQRLNESFDAQNVSARIRYKCKEMAMNLCQMRSNIKTLNILNTLSTDNDTDLSMIANIISNIWSKQHIKQKYSYRHIDRKYGNIMMDNIDHFFQKIDEIMSNAYKPTDEDVIKCQTVSPVVLQEYQWGSTRFQGVYYALIDAPTYCLDTIPKKGYMFDGIDGVIFVVSLSDYAVYRQDINKNALKHAMDQFEVAVNSKVFRKHGSSLVDGDYIGSLLGIEIILVFNKYDIFKEMIKNGISLSECFDNDEGWDKNKDYGNFKILMTVPCIARDICNEHGMQQIPVDIVQLIQQYVGVTDKDEEELDKYCQDALGFIVEEFVKLNKNENRRIFCHQLCAIDMNDVEKVFWDVQNILIQRGS